MFSMRHWIARCGGGAKCWPVTAAAARPDARALTRRLDRFAALLGRVKVTADGEEAMSCLEMPRSPVPDFLGEKRRTFNDAETMQPRAPAAVPAGRPQRRAGEVAGSSQPEGVYRPNYNVLTPNMRSPDYVQMSTAAAITLGVMRGYMHRTSCTRCLNLLLTYPEGCRANCAYCGLARHREADRNYADRNFIRVDWPAVPYDQVIDIVACRRRWRAFPSHVHQHDHASALRRGHPSRAEEMGRARSSTCRSPFCPIRPR